MARRTAIRKLICSKCRTEACAAGILMCENAHTASLVEVDHPGRCAQEPDAVEFKAAHDAQCVCTANGTNRPTED